MGLNQGPLESLSDSDFALSPFSPLPAPADSSTPTSAVDTRTTGRRGHRPRWLTVSGLERSSQLGADSTFMGNRVH